MLEHCGSFAHLDHAGLPPTGWGMRVWDRLVEVLGQCYLNLITWIFVTTGSEVECAGRIMGGLEECAASLAHLDLGNNRIRAEGPRCWSNACPLAHLDFGNNSMKERGGLRGRCWGNAGRLLI